MRKILMVVLIFTNVYFANCVSANENYNTFDDMQIQDGGKLLKDFTSSEYDYYYRTYLNNRKFIGWDTYSVHTNLGVKFRAETVFSQYNDGFTAIVYDITLEEKERSKRTISSTGSIGIKTDGKIKSFKSGLEADLKVSSTDESTYERNLTQTFKIQVDPGTQASLYIDGTGCVTNGVAIRYFFWITIEQGGYEIFDVASKYYRLEKTRVK